MEVLKRLFLTLSIYLFCASHGWAETRVALVIGNGAYQNAPQLPNPTNDANDVAAALKRDGFDTILATDLNRDAMEDATIRFAKAARNADVALFYYSGHAMQFAGVNYLAPVDIRLNDETDLRRMIKLDDVVSDLQQARNLRILVLDACRDNPLADQLKRSIGVTRSLPLQRGLAKIESPEGMIVSYATQPGRTAEDGNGRNSPYTAAFLHNIEAGEEIGTIFRRISTDVYQSTNHEQLPELSLSLIGEFYLRGKANAARDPGNGGTPDTASSLTNEAAQAWSSAKDSTSTAVIEAFIQRYGQTFYADLARARLNDLKQAASKPPQVMAALPPKAEDQVAARAAPLVQPVAPVAQRVVLYDEDPKDPKGKQYFGSVAWRTEPIKATGNQPADIAVRADIEIPDRKFKMTISFRRNTDASLPASHTAELTFILPPDFAGSGVQNVPGILMKSNEQARGTPLAGLAVKVTDGFFLVGLSNVDSDRLRNIQLLRERTWFDVPLVYTNGRRAIIAIEKGAAGAESFNVALAKWGQ